MVEFQREGNYWDTQVGIYCARTVAAEVPGESLLDLGCGDGILTQELCKHFPNVAGVEPYRDSLHKALIRCPNAMFYAVSVENLDLEDRFDVVTILLVLEHLRDPVKSLQKAASMLNPGGHVFVAVPNAKAINKRIGLIMGATDDMYHLSEYDRSMGNLRYYDRDTFRTDIQAAGLEIVKEGGIMFKTLSSPQMEWFLNHGKWGSGEFGWGDKDDFIKACYEIGKLYPEDCNIIYAIMQKGE